MINAIEVKDVNLIYPNGHQALSNLSFTLESGTVCALIGMNGSGKSSLFKSILNLEKITTGSIKIFGDTCTQAIKANKVAYVPQTETIDFNFPISVKEVIMQGRYAKMNIFRRPSKEDKEAVAKAVARLQLEELLDRQIGELSGGQKKRVFVARALAQEAELFLLDEPFGGVDISTENQIIELLPQLAKEGKTILISTHNLERVPEYCDKTLMIYRTVVNFGDTAEIYTPENLEKAFNPAQAKGLNQNPFEQPDSQQASNSPYAHNSKE